ncbi:hypothetical protein CEXT_236681 [Caerostris extrusa]|uniref:Uncharacterized protein n=1 Tax=Caerostris extrusa TaxID=172846 RepID=A0AAV4U884_CAEEX|nr:hypothetical protein CEXT_236681 [Caerostris extrusa]
MNYLLLKCLNIGKEKLEIHLFPQQQDSRKPGHLPSQLQPVLAAPSVANWTTPPILLPHEGSRHLISRSLPQKTVAEIRRYLFGCQDIPFRWRTYRDRESAKDTRLKKLKKRGRKCFVLARPILELHELQFGLV